MRKLNVILREIAIWIVVIGLAVMTIATIYNVANRFIFKNPITWTDEFTRYVFIWVSLMGAYVAVTERSHASVSFIVNKFSPKPKKTIELIAVGICMLICILFIVSGIILAQAQYKQFSPALSIRMTYIYLAIPISFFFMLIGFVNQALDIMSGEQQRFTDETEVII